MTCAYVPVRDLVTITLRENLDKNHMGDLVTPAWMLDRVVEALHQHGLQFLLDHVLARITPFTCEHAVDDRGQLGRRYGAAMRFGDEPGDQLPDLLIRKIAGDRSNIRF